MKRILTIAGSDSGGGAGIQADLKTITVLGSYGMSAITALTAQNTVGVQGVHPVPVDFITRQMESVLSDLGADAAKTGMLATPEIVLAVAEQLKRFRVERLVVDPVMVAKSGDALLSESARITIRDDLLPLAHVVTPNLPEASELCGSPVRDLDAMKAAARKIHELGPRFVLVKGGHLTGDAVDVLFDGDDFRIFDAPRLNNRNTHGTGCTFSAALATFLGQGMPTPKAVAEAKKFITRAIALGLDLGSGHGPTNHYAHVLRFVERERVLRDLQKGVERLFCEPMGDVIPEVRSNFGYAVPGAIDHQEVAAIPGRISQAGARLLVCRDPAFGASRHIAKVILAAMMADPEIRSAMNIRYSSKMVEICRSVGLQTASFDRGEEPNEVKAQEGSTLEWGTRRALKGVDPVPDVVYDEGEKGKEPMIRILGKNPMEVAEKVLRIWRASGTP
ncbi:MAG: bifunctional hydroxymethylpyrimidine kinase/phosphomethylpyrimidine kinase [Deltaproteobacteria bacterium]|nr:bifunctional hydroxymethylpyrimidine kinase/phosphomethylpyrimidine kinase [Deltaproteobacteria bacterium]